MQRWVLAAGSPAVQLAAVQLAASSPAAVQPVCGVCGVREQLQMLEAGSGCRFRASMLCLGWLACAAAAAKLVALLCSAGSSQCTSANAPCCTWPMSGLLSLPLQVHASLSTPPQRETRFGRTCMSIGGRGGRGWGGRSCGASWRPPPSTIRTRTTCLGGQVEFVSLGLQLADPERGAVQSAACLPIPPASRQAARASASTCHSAASQ